MTGAETRTNAADTASARPDEAAGEARFSGVRKRFTRRRVAVAALLLVTGFVVARKYVPFFVDDGFIAFVPDESQFPAAPAADARTEIGVGRPIGWPEEQFYCDYAAYSGWPSDSSVFERDWHTIRHDWEEAGSTKSWIISEQTVGFKDLREFDRYVQGFRDRTTYCGWTYDSPVQGTNSILTEFAGLPDGTVAFTIRLSPDAAESPDIGDADPAAFRGLGAFLPGRKRGQVMHVLWVGWGTEVPRDEFVAAANRLYDAAHQAPKNDLDSGDDRTIDYTFTEFEPEEAGILPLVGGDARARSESVVLSSVPCRRRFPPYSIWASSSALPPQATKGVENESDHLAFGASRWEKRSDYLDAKRTALNAGSAHCLGSYRTPSFWIEPIELSGLPDGTVVSKWHDDDFRDGIAYAATLTDDDKQMLMTVSWMKYSASIPDDRFVAVVNRAWEQFQADNP